MLTEKILSPATYVTELKSIGYCKTSDFFSWLISGKFSTIIDYNEIPTFLINEHKSR